MAVAGAAARAIDAGDVSGAARRANRATGRATGDLIARTLGEFAGSNQDFREQRREKYLAMGRSL